MSRFELFGKNATLTCKLHASLHFSIKINSSNCSHFEPVIRGTKNMEGDRGKKMGKHFSQKSIPYGSPRQGDRRKRTANGLSRFELFGKITTLTGNLHASLHFWEKIHSSNCSHYEPVIKDFPIRVNQDFSPRRRQNPGAGIRRGSGSRNTEGGREGEKTSSRLVPGAPRRGARNFQKWVFF